MIQPYDDGDGHVDVAFRCDKCEAREWAHGSRDELPPGWKEIDDEQHLCESCAIIQQSHD